MAERVSQLPQTLSALITERGYGRNRQPVLDAVGISAASLSQYIRGTTTPSVPKLLALAEFFEVSLDHLVYGTPHWTLAAPQPEVVRHVRDTFDEVKAMTTAHSALVGRVGRLLSDRVDEVTRQAVEAGSVEGLVEDDELMRLEACARRVDVVTIDLDANVIAMAEGGSAAGTFLDVVALALRRGCTYRFVVSSRPRTRDRSVAGFRELLADRVGSELVDARCAIRRATVPTVLGMGFYQIDLTTLSTEDPALHTQFGRNISDDGWFGYVIRPQPASDKDSVMDPRRLDTALAWFDTLWREGAEIR